MTEIIPCMPGAVHTWPLDRLKPYVRNAKMHGADQVAKIAASMAEFGWTVPCLVADDGELIAGHGRVLAAEQLGLREAPVIVLGHLTDEQRRAYRIADNKLTELGEWDEIVLSEELQLLASEDFDLSLIGFDDGELDALLSGLDDETDTEGEDDIPEPTDDPVSRPGDLWLLGNHRLLCGCWPVPRQISVFATRPITSITPEARGPNRLARGVGSRTMRLAMRLASSFMMPAC